MAAPVMAVICSGQQDVIIGDMKPGGFLLAGIISTLPLVAQNTGSNGPVVSVSEIYLIGSVHNMHFEERYH